MKYHTNLGHCKNENWKVASLNDIEPQREAYLKNHTEEDMEKAKEYYDNIHYAISNFKGVGAYFFGNCIASKTVLSSIPPEELLSIISYLKDFCRESVYVNPHIYFTKPSLSFLYFIECYDPKRYDGDDELKWGELNYFENANKWGTHFLLKFAYEPYDIGYYKFNMCSSYLKPQQ